MASRGDKLTLALMSTIALGLFTILVLEFAGGGKSKPTRAGGPSAGPAASDSGATTPAATPNPAPTPSTHRGGGVLNG